MTKEIEREDFADWWGDLSIVDEEGGEYDIETYAEDYADRVWAIEYAYEHGWDVDDILDMMYEDNAEFWDWFRENY